MNKDRSQALDLLGHLAQAIGELPTGVEVIVAPAFPFLSLAVERLQGTAVAVAAQHCHEAVSGAFTGEVSAAMLASCGVKACIVGHSERRQYFGETDAAVHARIQALLAVGITPIYCCGEMRADREAGRHQEVVGAQMHDALTDLSGEAMSKLIVAYEPVWAVGTGQVATPEQVEEAHTLLRKHVGDKVPILYGGSVKSDNSAQLAGLKNVNGFLIGGASLKVDEFLKIYRSRM